jgi:hypothetical protein
MDVSAEASRGWERDAELFKGQAGLEAQLPYEQPAGLATAAKRLDLFVQLIVFVLQYIFDPGPLVGPWFGYFGLV